MTDKQDNYLYGANGGGPDDNGVVWTDEMYAEFEPAEIETIEFQEDDDTYVEPLDMTRDWTFDELQEMPYEEFVEWTQSTQKIDGRYVYPLRETNWIKRNWIDKRKMMYIWEARKKWHSAPGVSLEPKMEGLVPEVLPLTPLHVVSFKEKEGYHAMDSYHAKVSEYHDAQMKDILDQVAGPVIAPADGYGLVASLREGAICGDINGRGEVLNETISETLLRGGRDLPVILSYCYRFCTEEDKAELISRPGPVIILDEWPIVIPRLDLRSVSHGMTSYGIKVTQHTYMPDNSKIRARLPYDWNLSQVTEGYNWYSWNPYLWHLIKTAPHLTHWSPHSWLRDALAICGNLASTPRITAAAATVGELEVNPGAYFCPLGRKSPISNADRPTSWLLGGVVYRSQHTYFDDIADNGYVVGLPGQVKNGITFLPSDATIFRGQGAQIGNIMCAKPRIVLATWDFQSLETLAHYFFPEYDEKRIREFRSKVGYDFPHLLGPHLYAWCQKYGPPNLLAQDEQGCPLSLRNYMKEAREYMHSRGYVQKRGKWVKPDCSKKRKKTARVKEHLTDQDHVSPDGTISRSSPLPFIFSDSYQ